MATKSSFPKNQVTSTIEADPRWAQVRTRDKSADGTFWYSVRTTGVYCRPSCPSRTANPKNVTLHDDVASARAADSRPCKRCNPDGKSQDADRAALVTKACRLIEKSDEPPALEGLAKAVGLSPSYFHRLFKATTGLTPKAYAIAHRASRVRAGLAKGNSVTEAIYDAGFNSSGRFYETSTKMLGMTPTRYKKGGANEEIRFAIGESRLGAILVASSTKGVVAILMDDDPEKLVRDLQDRFPKAHLTGGDREYEKRVGEVIGFVEAPSIGHDLPLDIRGTVFQRRVWQALQEIPVGKTATYAEIAVQIGMPTARRAVAAACAANKIAVAVPCHRVIRSDGSLSGYAWGIDRKQRLLEAEAAR